jgi:hypothetical protein
MEGQSRSIEEWIFRKISLSPEALSETDDQELS